MRNESKKYIDKKSTIKSMKLLKKLALGFMCTNAMNEHTQHGIDQHDRGNGFHSFAQDLQLKQFKHNNLEMLNAEEYQMPGETREVAMLDNDDELEIFYHPNGLHGHGMRGNRHVFFGHEQHMDEQSHKLLSYVNVVLCPEQFEDEASALSMLNTWSSEHGVSHHGSRAHSSVESSRSTPRSDGQDDVIVLPVVRRDEEVEVCNADEEKKRAGDPTALIASFTASVSLLLQPQATSSSRVEAWLQDTASGVGAGDTQKPVVSSSFPAVVPLSVPAATPYTYDAQVAKRQQELLSAQRRRAEEDQRVNDEHLAAERKQKALAEQQLELKRQADADRLKKEAEERRLQQEKERQEAIKAARERDAAFEAQRVQEHEKLDAIVIAALANGETDDTLRERLKGQYKLDAINEHVNAYHINLINQAFQANTNVFSFVVLEAVDRVKFDKFDQSVKDHFATVALVRDKQVIDAAFAANVDGTGLDVLKKIGGALVLSKFSHEVKRYFAQSSLVRNKQVVDNIFKANDKFGGSTAVAALAERGLAMEESAIGKYIRQAKDNQDKAMIDKCFDVVATTLTGTSQRLVVLFADMLNERNVKDLSSENANYSKQKADELRMQGTDALLTVAVSTGPLSTFATGSFDVGQGIVMPPAQLAQQQQVKVKHTVAANSSATVTLEGHQVPVLGASVVPGDGVINGSVATLATDQNGATLVGLFPFADDSDHEIFQARLQALRNTSASSGSISISGKPSSKVLDKLLSGVAVTAVTSNDDSKKSDTAATDQPLVPAAKKADTVVSVVERVESASAAPIIVSSTVSSAVPSVSILSATTSQAAPVFSSKGAMRTDRPSALVSVPTATSFNGAPNVPVSVRMLAPVSDVSGKHTEVISDMKRDISANITGNGQEALTVADVASTPSTRSAIHGVMSDGGTRLHTVGFGSQTVISSTDSKFQRMTQALAGMSAASKKTKEPSFLEKLLGRDSEKKTQLVAVVPIGQASATNGTISRVSVHSTTSVVPKCADIAPSIGRRVSNAYDGEEINSDALVTLDDAGKFAREASRGAFSNDGLVNTPSPNSPSSLLPSEHTITDGCDSQDEFSEVFLIHAGGNRENRTISGRSYSAGDVYTLMKEDRSITRAASAGTEPYSHGMTDLSSMHAKRGTASALNVRDQEFIRSDANTSPIFVHEALASALPSESEKSVQFAVKDVLAVGAHDGDRDRGVDDSHADDEEYIPSGVLKSIRTPRRSVRRGGSQESVTASTIFLTQTPRHSTGHADAAVLSDQMQELIRLHNSLDTLVGEEAAQRRIEQENILNTLEEAYDDFGVKTSEMIAQGVQVLKPQSYTTPRKLFTPRTPSSARPVSSSPLNGGQGFYAVSLPSTPEVLEAVDANSVSASKKAQADISRTGGNISFSDAWVSDAEILAVSERLHVAGSVATKNLRPVSEQASDIDFIQEDGQEEVAPSADFKSLRTSATDIVFQAQGSVAASEKSNKSSKHSVASLVFEEENSNSDAMEFHMQDSSSSQLPSPVVSSSVISKTTLKEGSPSGLTARALEEKARSASNGRPTIFDELAEIRNWTNGILGKGDSLPLSAVSDTASTMQFEDDNDDNEGEGIMFEELEETEDNDGIAFEETDTNESIDIEYETRSSHLSQRKASGKARSDASSVQFAQEAVTDSASASAHEFVLTPKSEDSDQARLRSIEEDLNRQHEAYYAKVKAEKEKKAKAVAAKEKVLGRWRKKLECVPNGVKSNLTYAASHAIASKCGSKKSDAQKAKVESGVVTGIVTNMKPKAHAHPDVPKLNLKKTQKTTRSNIQIKTENESASLHSTIVSGGKFRDKQKDKQRAKHGLTSWEDTPNTNDSDRSKFDTKLAFEKKKQQQEDGDYDSNYKGPDALYKRQRYQERKKQRKLQELRRLLDQAYMCKRALDVDCAEQSHRLCYGPEKACTVKVYAPDEFEQLTKETYYKFNEKIESMTQKARKIVENLREQVKKLDPQVRAKHYAEIASRRKGLPAPKTVSDLKVPRYEEYLLYDDQINWGDVRSDDDLMNEIYRLRGEYHAKTTA